MIEERSKSPREKDLSMFDYTQASKATLNSTAIAGDTEEWIEVELCADTGACDTVMPRSMCKMIPMTPSLQSLSCMEYEVADGSTIPNLGERKCVMWTDGAAAPR